MAQSGDAVKPPSERLTRALRLGFIWVAFLGDLVRTRIPSCRLVEPRERTGAVRRRQRGHHSQSLYTVLAVQCYGLNSKQISTKRIDAPMVGTTKVYSGVGADIVMESIALRRKSRGNSFGINKPWQCASIPM